MAATPVVADAGHARWTFRVRDFGKSRAKAQRWKKKREARPSLNYTQRGFRLRDGTLHLAGGIAVMVVWSRELAAAPSSVRVYQDSLGHWYCSFVVPAEVQPFPETGAVIGIDWGVREKVVRDHDALAVEDFRPKFLAKKTPGRKAADAAISATKAALVEMGRKRGRTVYLVHPAHTTMDCAQCGARTKHALPLSERTYACTVYGVVSPRDKNSARVMLARAGLNPASADRGRPDQAPPGLAA